MQINEKCMGCKKLCKALENEDVKNCKNYDPLPVASNKKEVHKSNERKIIIRRR